MKEHGLLFKAEMVRAILNTKPGVWPAEPIDRTKPWKWQTRRFAKFEPHPSCPNINLLATSMSPGEYCTGCPESGYVLYSKDGACWQQRTKPLHAPHGPVGRKLWVKETWAPVESAFCKMPICEIKGVRLLYRADGDAGHIQGPWRSAMLMPHWASRLGLEVKAVRVERVREITYGDALAEGIPLRSGFWYPDGTPKLTAECDDYLDLFAAINGRESVEKNAWVFVYEFMRVE